MRYMVQFGFPIEQGLYFRLIPNMMASLKSVGLFYKIKPLLVLYVSVLVFYVSDSHFLTLLIKCKGLIDLIQKIQNSHFVSFKDKDKYLEIEILAECRKILCDYKRTKV